MKQKLVQQLSVKKGNCSLCGKPCIVVPVEKLPNGGIVYTALHDKSKKNHLWSKFNTLEEAGKQAYIRNPKRMTCPKCGEKGRVNWFIHDPRKPFLVSYYVIHEKIDGYWGKDKRMRRQRRCYLYGKDRVPILKKLGYFITFSSSK